MDSLEKVTSNLKLTEAKKLRVQKAILSLLVEWKDLDNHVDSSKNLFAELETRQRNLNSVQESVTESNRMLEEIKANLERRIEEVEFKAKEFRLMCENQSKEFGLKEKKLEFLERNLKDIELREEKISAQENLIGGFFEKFDFERGEFERIGNLVGERFEEMKLKEKCIESREIELDGIWNELELKEMNLVRVENLNEDKMKELGVREEILDSRERNLVMIKKCTEDLSVDFHMDFHIKMEKLELEKKLVEERGKELELKEKHFREWVKNIDLKEKEIDHKLKEFELKEMHLKNHVKSVGLKEKGSYSIDFSSEEKCRELEFREKQLDKQLKEFELKEKYFKDWVKSIDLKEKEIDSMNISVGERCRELEFREKQLDSRLKEFDELKEKHFKELELRDEQVHNQLRAFELREKHISNIFKSMVKTEPLGDDPSYADIRFSVSMDGKSLLLYLIEHERDLDLMADEVAKALKLSKDPAKLVLDAIEGFHASYLKKGDKEFRGFVIRKSCILLLEQLRRIFPKIQPHVKEAALKRAGEWKEKMIAGGESSLELTGWLQLLACYGLGSDFEPGELLSLFEVFGQQGQIPELCKLLGYTDKISDLVPNLVNVKHHVMAIRYVCAFGLNDKFQPASLLQDFLKHAEEKSKALYENGNNSVNTMNEAIDNIVASLNDALGCIANHKLESEFSPKCLELFIEQLIKQKEDQKFKTSDSPRNAQKQQKSEKNDKSETAVSIPTETCTIQLDFEAISPVSEDPANTMVVILAHMDKNSLQLFLNEHFKESLGDNMNGMAKIQNLICGKVGFIPSASDPAKLVLDALQGCYYSNPKEIKNPNFIVMRSFCTLLEKLLKLSPEIKPHVKEAAIKFALDWKAQLLQSRSKPFEVFVFIRVLTIYKLGSSFDADELLGLFHSVYERRTAPELFRLLSLAHKISDFIESLVQKDDRLQAIRYIYAFEVAEKFPPVPILKAHLTYSKELAKKICKEGKNSKAAAVKSIGKELFALKAVIKCIKVHQLELEYPPQQLFARIEQLERQKANVNNSLSPAPAPAPAPAHVSKTQQNQENLTRAESHGKMKKKHIPVPALAPPPSPSPSAAAAVASSPAPAPASKTQSNQENSTQSNQENSTQSNQENSTRAESHDKFIKKRRAAAQDFGPQLHWQHFSKRPRIEPLAETALNASPVDLLHEPSQLQGGPYTHRGGHYTERGQPYATHHHRHYSLGDWFPPVTPHFNHF